MFSWPKSVTWRNAGLAPFCEFSAKANKYTALHLSFTDNSIILLPHLHSPSILYWSSRDSCEMHIVNLLCITVGYFLALFIIDCECAAIGEAQYASPTPVTIVARATYNVVPVSTTTNSADTYNSPQIWVARGMVDCGPPLFSNPCTSLQYTATTTWVDQSSETEYYIYSGYSYTTLDPNSSDRFSPVVVPTKFVSKNFATVNTPGAGSYARNYVPRTVATTASSSPSPTAHVTKRTPQINEHLPVLARRDYGSTYDICLGIPPGQSLKTNKLADVCNFVSNANDSFVSLAPTDGAYLPSWLSYFVAFIAVIISLLYIKISPSAPYFTTHISVHETRAGQRYMTGEYTVAIIALVFSSIRTALGAYQIGSHWNSFDALPFITPLLWVDWLILIHVLGGRFKKYVIVVALIVWGLCFWLCIGYAFLKYGTRQYDVLELSQKCEYTTNNLSVSWQTDPRRFRFVDLHCVIFGFGTWTLFEGWSAFEKTKIERERRTYIYGQEIHKLLYWVIGAAVLVCLAGGMVLAGLLNEKDYLILTQNKCYASYVSSRVTYTNVDAIDLAARVSEWFGINV